MLGGLSGGGEITHVESKLPLSSLKHARKKGKKGNGGGHPLGGLSFYSRIRCELPRATTSYKCVWLSGKLLHIHHPNIAAAIV